MMCLTLENFCSQITNSKLSISGLNQLVESDKKLKGLQKDKVSLKIPIEKYNELTQAILKINPSDFTKDMKFCADGASIEIGFGASDRATYSLSCVSPEYEKHKDVVFVVKLIMEISKIKFHDF